MPSHVHMIISSAENKLEDIVRDMKSHTSTALRKEITENATESRREWMLWIACPDFLSGMKRAGRKNGNNNDWQFWQQHNKPILLLNDVMFHQKLTYIHNNPAEAGFVAKAEDWLFSSAGFFYGKKGLIELSCIS